MLGKKPLTFSLFFIIYFFFSFFFNLYPSQAQDGTLGACRIANPYDKVEAASSRLNKRQDGASTISPDRLLEDKTEQDGIEKEKIIFSADRIEFDQELKKIQGMGNVKVTFKKVSVTSDEFILTIPEASLVARGQINLEADNKYQVKGDDLHFNTDSGLWSIQNSQVLVSPSYYFTAERAEQVSKEKIIIRKASYTACDPESPAWRISFSEGTINPGKSVKLKNTVFKIRNAPVLFIPYFIFPLNQEKATGFLTPDFGRSNLWGMFIENYFYWPISEWNDLGFPITYYEKKGVGFGIDYRYALTKDDFGYIHAYNIFDRQKEQNRGDLSLKLQQTLPAGTRGVADVTILSDDDYYRDFQQEISKRYSQFLDSQVFVEKISDPWQGRILAIHTKTLKPDQNISYSKAPEIDLQTKLRSFLHLPLFFQWDSSWTHAQIDDPDQAMLKIQRMDFSPRLFYSFTSPFVTITPSLSYRKTYYHQAQYHLNVSDEVIIRDLYGGGIDLTGPKLSRLFSSQFNHLWYPHLSLTYQKLDQEKDVAVGVDAIDRLGTSRKITLAIINKLLGEKNELLNLIIRQTYSLAHDVYLDQKPKENSGFSELELEASSRPQKNHQYSLTYIYDQDTSQSKLADFNLSFASQSHFSLDLGWRYNRICPAETSLDTNNSQSLHFLRGAVGIPFHQRWTGKIKSYYDLNQNSTIENQYSLSFRGSCWSTEFKYIYRFDSRRWDVKLYLDSLGDVI